MVSSMFRRCTIAVHHWSFNFTTPKKSKYFNVLKTKLLKNIAFARLGIKKVTHIQKTRHMQLVLIPAEAITTPVEPNPSYVVHLMPTPAEISQTTISRSFCATASKNSILDLGRSNTKLSGFCIFFLYFKHDWLKSG